MNTFRKVTLVLLRFFKQLNLFTTYTTNQKQIRREIITTRIYLILLPTILTILIVYSAQKELYHTVQVNNPSIDTYQRLLKDSSNTLLCPCSRLSVPYSTFVKLTPHFHPVCSSDFVADRWLEYLYYDDASSYFVVDIRSVGNAQFQLLRILCQSSEQAIADAFISTFTSATLVSNLGMLLNEESVQIQVEAFADDFVVNIGSEQRRRRALFSTFFDQNFLMSGLRTSARLVVESTSHLEMQPAAYYPPSDGDPSSASLTTCTCEVTYACGAPLKVCNNSLYLSENIPYSGLYQGKDVCPAIVDGFNSGCLPLNSLHNSTLECYYDQSCLNNIMNHLPTANTSFNILERDALNRSIPSTPISELANNLMVDSWSTQMNYSLYFSTCRPSSCSYTYTERFSTLYIVTTLIGLIGGLITILRFLCPQLTSVVYRIRNYKLLEKANKPTNSLLLSKSEKNTMYFRKK